MKGGPRQKINVSELVESYQLRLNTSNEQQKNLLQQSIYDLHTLIRFGHSQFLTRAAQLRKKAAQRQKLFRQSESLAFQLQDLFVSQPGANCQIAYNILALTSPPILKQNKTKLLKELKLAFLESHGVTLSEWNSFFRPELVALAVTVPGKDVQALLQLEQRQDSRDLQWVVTDASLGGQSNHMLMHFLQGAIKCSRQKCEDWGLYVISEVKSILNNIESLLIFFELYKATGEETKQLGKSNQTLACSWESDGMTINAHWDVSFNYSENQTIFSLRIQEASSILQLIICGKSITGSIKLNSSQNICPVLHLNTSNVQFILPRDFILLPKLIFQFQQSINKLYNQHPQVKQQPHTIFIRLLGKLWLPSSLSEADIGSALRQGVWMSVPIENGVFLQIDQEGELCSSICDRKLLSHMLKSSISLRDSCRHLRLLERIKTDNDSFEYKLYDMKFGKWDSHLRDYLIYEFRSTKFIQNLKYFKNSSRIEEKFIQPDKNSFDNLVLIVRISFDFTRVYFSSWKFHQGPTNESEKPKYLPKDWIQYCSQLSEGQRLDWQRLADAVGYYCRCYLAERVRHRVFSEEDRKLNLIEFN